jgi:hypothetical protein
MIIFLCTNQHKCDILSTIFTVEIYPVTAIIHYHVAADKLSYCIKLAILIVGFQQTHLNPNVASGILRTCDNQFVAQRHFQRRAAYKRHVWYLVRTMRIIVWTCASTIELGARFPTPEVDFPSIIL